MNDNYPSESGGETKQPSRRDFIKRSSVASAAIYLAMNGLTTNAWADDFTTTGTGFNNIRRGQTGTGLFAPDTELLWDCSATVTLSASAGSGPWKLVISTLDGVTPTPIKTINPYTGASAVPGSFDQFLVSNDHTTLDPFPQGKKVVIELYYGSELVLRETKQF